jgi:hypothetical protein
MTDEQMKEIRALIIFSTVAIVVWIAISTLEILQAVK